MAGGLLIPEIIDRPINPLLARQEVRDAVLQGRAPNIIRETKIQQFRRMQGPTGNAPLDAASEPPNVPLQQAVGNDTQYAAPYASDAAWTTKLYNSVGGAGGIAVGVGVLAAIGVGIYLIRK